MTLSQKPHANIPGWLLWGGKIATTCVGRQLAKTRMSERGWIKMQISVEGN